jgi:hypothetical protein
MGRATSIAMARYGLSRDRAVAVLKRLADRQQVDLRVVALAVVAAAVARRAQSRRSVVRAARR